MEDSSQQPLISHHLVLPEFFFRRLIAETKNLQHDLPFGFFG